MYANKLKSSNKIRYLINKVLDVREQNQTLTSDIWLFEDQAKNERIKWHVKIYICIISTKRASSFLRLLTFLKEEELRNEMR